ncbi:hypothetical protein [Acidithiobacillus sp.]
MFSNDLLGHLLDGDRVDTIVFILSRGARFPHELLPTFYSRTHGPPG